MSVIRRLWNVGKGRFRIARQVPNARAEAALDAELASEKKPAPTSAGSTDGSPTPEPSASGAPASEPTSPDPAVDPYDPAAPDRKRTL